MDAISKHAETHGKTTTKDAKGNTYILLDTASTDCESTIAMLTEERGRGDSGVLQSSEEKRRSDKPVNHRGEVVEANGAVPTRVNGSMYTVTSPPLSTSAEGVSTHTATEIAKQRKDTKQPNTNVSDSIHILTSACWKHTLWMPCLWWKRYASNPLSTHSLYSLLGSASGWEGCCTGYLLL